MSEPILELVLLGDTKVVAHACGKCRVVAYSEAAAKECCSPRHCDKCGEVIPGNSYCMPCQAKKEQAQHEKWLATAKRVPESETEYLYCPCCEEFFADSDELFDSHINTERGLPEHAKPCDKIRLELDAERIVGNALENGDFHEGAGDDISPSEFNEFQKFLDWWCERANVVSYFPDNGSLVDLTEKRAAVIAENP